MTRREWCAASWSRVALCCSGTLPGLTTWDACGLKPVRMRFSDFNPPPGMGGLAFSGFNSPPPVTEPACVPSGGGPHACQVDRAGGHDCAMAVPVFISFLNFKKEIKRTAMGTLTQARVRVLWSACVPQVKPDCTNQFGDVDVFALDRFR